jgi:hypothetical protein
VAVAVDIRSCESLLSSIAGDLCAVYARLQAATMMVAARSPRPDTSPTTNRTLIVECDDVVPVAADRRLDLAM